MNRYAKDLQAKRDAAKANYQIRQIVEKQAIKDQYGNELEYVTYGDPEFLVGDYSPEYH